MENGTPKMEEVITFLLSSNDGSVLTQKRNQFAERTLWSFGYRSIVNRYRINYPPDMGYLDRWLVVLHMMSQCQRVYMIEGWDACPLACAEFHLAQILELDVMRDFWEKGDQVV